jgi:hypothetical protein
MTNVDEFSLAHAKQGRTTGSAIEKVKFQGMCIKKGASQSNKGITAWQQLASRNMTPF